MNVKHLTNLKISGLLRRGKLSFQLKKEKIGNIRLRERSATLLDEIHDNGNTY